VARALALRADLERRGLDAGPHTLVWHLANEDIRVSPATVSRILTRHGAVTPDPSKRPKSYNHRRPHRALGRTKTATPAAAYAARPKATPTGVQPTHERVRRDRIDDSGVVTLRHHGRLHHIGIGRTHTRTHVLLLIQNLNIRIIAETTGELLRDLVLDPTRDYQPQPARPNTQGPNP
jgi:hypothetical protein